MLFRKIDMRKVGTHICDIRMMMSWYEMQCHPCNYLPEMPNHMRGDTTNCILSIRRHSRTWQDLSSLFRDPKLPRYH